MERTFICHSSSEGEEEWEEVEEGAETEET